MIALTPKVFFPNEAFIPMYSSRDDGRRSGHSCYLLYSVVGECMMRRYSSGFGVNILAVKTQFEFMNFSLDFLFIRCLVDGVDRSMLVT